jgi:hypothetical protein
MDEDDNTELTGLEALMLPLDHPKIRKAVKEIEAVWEREGK